MASSEGEKVGIEEARLELASGDALAVDVRSEEEWSEGHVPGAIHLSAGETDPDGELPEHGSRLMVIAKSGKLAVKAAADLSEQGYDAVAVDGDMGDWLSEGFNIQPTVDPGEETDLGLK